MKRIIDKATALDWACAIFLVSVAGIWSMGGPVTIQTMTGGALAGAIAGPVLRWQTGRNG